MGLRRKFKNWLKKKEHQFYVEGKEIEDSRLKKQFVSMLGHVDGIDIHIYLPYYLMGAEYISIGDTFVACPGLRMECIDSYEGQHYEPKLVIGNNVCFNYNCHVGCINEITIGNDVLIGSRVLITDHMHGKLEQSEKPYSERQLISKGKVIINDNVWIGENACIMPGVTIGKGSIIGANAVVTHDVPPFSVAAGVPAKIIKRLK